ncbi:MAG: hypothetical protein CL773_03695 [Chloroflexi bacterium]|nr:hypothetical protein [Chloroflexota bacterium]|tara:strand:- start:5978 stop:6169 length:192 start_codon:yes stop_codon:yes gene_type:complete
MKKFGSITLVISLLHFLEDATLVALERFTELNFLSLLIGTVVFGLIIAWLARQEKVKNWLSTD